MSSRIAVSVVCSRGCGPERGGRALNQDNFLICEQGQARYRNEDGEKQVSINGPGVMTVVADGMGGHEDGDLASAAAVRALSRLYGKGAPSDPSTAIHAFLLKAHRRLHARASERGPVNMGTTVTMAWVLEDKAYWAHIGDSRLYHFRDDSMVQITRDQTRLEFAQRDGLPQPSYPEYLAQTFLYGSRGLGNDAEIRIDSGTDTGVIKLKVGDRLLLCSDGLSGFLPEDRIFDCIRQAHDPNDCTDWLVEQAINAGSDDNITVMVARVDAISASTGETDGFTNWSDDEVTCDALVPLDQ